MPTYRSITISLTSQFDILTIPEYAPPKVPNDPFAPAPSLVNPEDSLVSVYIPTYPGSRFWLSYSIAPPHPPKALYYFKLFLNGKCVVSWGCGEKDAYKGKTMYGLFDSGLGWMGETGVDVRAFCFGDGHASWQPFLHDDLSQFMEVKVYRAKGRMRMQPQFPDVKEFGAITNDAKTRRTGSKSSSQNAVQAAPKSGITLIHAGGLPCGHPQNYYKYALIDPCDKPFATFRYYHRTWDQLEAIGVISPASSTSPSIRSSAPSRGHSEAQTDESVQVGPSTPHSRTLVSSSPASTADISPLLPRLPTISVVDLPPPRIQLPMPSPPKRPISPIPMSSSSSSSFSSTAATTSRFAELVRRSNRPQSPPIPPTRPQSPFPGGNSPGMNTTRPQNPFSGGHSTSMNTIMGALNSAIRRKKKAQYEKNIHDENSTIEKRKGETNGEEAAMAQDVNSQLNENASVEELNDRNI
ncbi:MAG: hypothetical protein Q9214_007348 [Letrouitia sp. 1 TL-2023]